MLLKLIIITIYATISVRGYCPKIWQNKSLGELYKIDRMIGNEPAARGEFPHQVSLQIGYPPYSEFTHICGGAIINSKWILTAAYCLNNLSKHKYKKFAVKAGKNYIMGREDMEQVAYESQSFIHRQYHGTVSPFDIALIKLKTPLVFNDRVNSILLPKANVIPEGNAVLSGWGSTSKTRIPMLKDYLQKVTLPIIDLNTCSNALLTLGEPWKVHDTNICTGPLIDEASACLGDLGGPLIIRNENGVNEIVGVVSWGVVPCAGVGVPAVFVRVSAFIDWIDNIIKSYS